jgi:hypothetical protein
MAGPAGHAVDPQGPNHRIELGGNGTVIFVPANGTNPYGTVC